jgi:hypothetical protein
MREEIDALEVVAGIGAQLGPRPGPERLWQLAVELPAQDRGHVAPR